MKSLLAGALLALALNGSAWAGGVAFINVESPTYPQGQSQAAAQDYLRRYPDVAAVYHNSPAGAVQHWQQYGQFEGWRTWNAALDITILSYCEDPNRISGNNCAHFPQGGRIGAISWESSTKVDNSEIFYALFVSDGRVLMTTYQQGKGARVKTVTLPTPFVVPAGGFIYLHAQGWGDYNAGGIETQIGLYLLD